MIELLYRPIGPDGRPSDARIDTVSTDDNIIIHENEDADAEGQSVRHSVCITAKNDVVLDHASSVIPRHYDSDDLIMANGYQSWTETREFRMGEFLNDLSRTPSVIDKIFHFTSYGSQYFQKNQPDTLTGFDWSYIRGKDPFFIGSFNFRNAYLLIIFYERPGIIVLQSDVEGRIVKKGESFTIFDYLTASNGEVYWNSFSLPVREKLFGYTTWYDHYQNINEKLIIDEIEKADERFDLFQIDDGSSTHTGDWFDIDKAKFPNGLEQVVKKIHDRSMLAGIWLAPFVAEEDSAVAEEQPDWIAHDNYGQPIYAGSNWSGALALDLNKKAVCDYVREVLHYYVDMGFDLFKLDFLYACDLKPLNGRTRAETAEFAYGLLREALGSRLILGCGATLMNAYDKFDYCRVGPDVSLSFDDAPYMKLFHPERISTRVTLQNTIFRYPMDGHVFYNDPDVFMLRDDNNKLSEAQKISLTDLNALFGSLFLTSDKISEYDEKKRALLEHALDIFRNGKVISSVRENDHIHIVYEISGKHMEKNYYFEKGVIR